MKVAWINPCFLHYRVPVYAALDRLLGGRLTVIFSADRTPSCVGEKITAALGDRAVGLRGEYRLNLGADGANFANVGLKVPYQPGLLRAVAAARPDVIVSEGFFQWTPVSLWYKARHRVPLVITYERTAHTERNAGALRTFYRRWIAKRTDAIACNGVLSKQYCRHQLRVPEARIVTGAMAADSDMLTKRITQISANARLPRIGGRPLSHPVVLYVGRLICLKGLRELLTAWGLYNHRRPNPGTLLLVGDGPERSRLEKMVGDLKLSNVLFAGEVPYEEIVDFFAAADVLVMPTLEDNWSLVVPEAMACGLPILCSSYNGCWPELVHPDRNGWVFDPKDTEQFASLLQVVHRDRERLPQMGEASRAIVQDFGPAQAAKAVLTACRIAASSDQRS